MSHAKQDGGELSKAEQENKEAQEELKAGLKGRDDDLASRQGRPTSRTADEGMVSQEQVKSPASGALDHAGHRVVVDRSMRSR